MAPGGMSFVMTFHHSKPIWRWKSGAKFLVALGRGGGTARAQNNKVFLLLFVHKK
jgi:hypothetical protein